MTFSFKIEDDVFYQKGINKGVQKKEEQTILNAYKKGKKIHEIAEFLDLDIDFVKNIIEQNEQK